MNENNDNIFKPKATGPIVAAVVLILVIALVVALVSVIATIGSKADDDETTTTTSTTVKDPDSTTTTQQSTGDDPSTNPDGGGDGNGDGSGEDDPGTNTVPTVNIDTNKVYEGNLLLIDEANYYRFDKDLLISRSDMAKLTSAKLLEVYNFVNVHGKSGGNYSVKANTGYYLDAETLEAFNKMMAAYAEESGNKDVQVRNAYYYEEGKVCLNATGKVLDLEINKSKGTYPLNYATYKADYYNWFIENCGKYGFIHVEDQNNYSKFRYVGAPHAAYMEANDLDLAEYLTAIKAYRYENRLVISDAGTEWWIYYVPGSGAETAVPAPSTEYLISGNNVDGFVVAINASQMAAQ